MSDCEKIPMCPFFNNNLKKMPDAAEKMKRDYCHGVFFLCARYKVARVLGSEGVPENLYPTMEDTADRILDDNQ